jgi:hypothetical protein
MKAFSFKHSLGLLACAAGVIAVSNACSAKGSSGQLMDTRKPAAASTEKPTCQSEDFLEGKLNSNTFSLSADEVFEINPDDIGIELATSVVRSIGDKKGCKESGERALTIDSKESECKEIIDGSAASEACFVKTNRGEFFVIRDALDGVTVVFNRLD